MTFPFRSIARTAALALLVTVITQAFCIAASSSGATPNREVIWSLEVLAFVALAITGLALVPARPVAGAGIAAGGIFNTVQAGMGLVMFGPLMEAGDALSPVLSAVLAMAFLLYFAGKIAFGAAALALALPLWRGSGLAKALGGLAGLSGLIAVILNLLAIYPGSDLTFPAGGAGTVAAFFLALALLRQPDQSA